jgi:hypothetical protein
MSATLHDFEIGENVTAVTITGKNPNAATGVLEGTTPENILAVFDEMDMSTQPEHEDVKPSWKQQINMVRTAKGVGMTLTTLKRARDGQALTRIAQNFSHALVVFEDGKENWNGHYTVGRFGNSHRGPGAQRVTLELLPCDPTIPQVASTVDA